MDHIEGFINKISRFIGCCRYKITRRILIIRYKIMELEEVSADPVLKEIVEHRKNYANKLKESSPPAESTVSNQ